MQLTASVALVGTLLLELHDASAHVVHLPPSIGILCSGLTREALLTCVTRNNGTLESEPVPNVVVVKDAKTHFVFVLADGVHAATSWPLSLEADLEVTSSVKMDVDGVSLRRVDLRVRSKLAKTRSDFVLRHEVLLCRRDACQRVTLECSRIRDGRAVEAFVGHLVGTYPLISAEGDRTHLARCP